ncbi:hypothetical protein CS006_06865 [Bifidobacterium primatium]|uniref:RloB-like protein n=1 Tax=Bifidobacterium primatium TaxID=2045438 RepID=A0A2M9H835_9BIFI|nr:RloB family protein [Bifidobacterium primatium]PJM72969.1 hypothetical protein CS006_06865 [Bifidobacterium primatium]
MSRRKTKLPAHGRNARRRHRTRAKRYLVVCGGEVTEKDYFEHLGAQYDVQITVRSKIRTPAQLAEYAVKCMDDDAKNNDEQDRYAAVFVVVDVDDFHDHSKAQRICKQNGIQLIISNPCFEVWLIDHVQQCPDSHTSTPDVERYAASLGVTTGPRHKYVEFSHIDGHLSDAVRNARRHNTQGRLPHRRQLTAGQESQYAPWTDVADMVNDIIPSL